MNARIAIPFLKYPDGWQGWCYVSTETEVDKYKYFCRFDQEQKPDTVQVSAYISKCVERAISEENSVVAIAPNDRLASLAVAAKAILDKSQKLQAPEIQEMLERLVDGVKGASNADPADGDSATMLVNEILADPAIQAQPELRGAIEQAFRGIQDMTGGVL